MATEFSAGPYHAGERAVQERTGLADIAQRHASGIRDAIPLEVAPFLAQQYMAALGAADGQGDLWASLLLGPPGFARSIGDGSALFLRLHDGDRHLAQTPPFTTLVEGAPVGTLFIDLAHRRRFRVNGKVITRAPDRLVLEVDQAIGNCPKFIQRRRPEGGGIGETAPGVFAGEGLSAEARTWIAAADTFFVASGDGRDSVDVSHRGGAPGFVRIEGDELVVPDYVGNAMFTTLGNFAVNPKAGLVFIDFDRGRQLHLTGDVMLAYDGLATSGHSQETERHWRFRSRHWVTTPLNLPFAWRLEEVSPFNP